MIKRTLLTLGCGSLSMLSSTAQAAAPEQKPNVVFIFADDLMFSALDSIEMGVIHAPNLNRLRESGANFTHAFNQGAYNPAVSTASRAMLNTGRYIWKAGNSFNAPLELTPDDTQWPADTKPYVGAQNTAKMLWGDYMKAAGYDTYITGKWHVPVDAAQRFDHAKNIRGGMPNQTPEGYAYGTSFNKAKEGDNIGEDVGRKFIEGVEDTWQPYDTSYNGFWRGGKHWSELLADDAIEYLEQAWEGENPYFMYFAFNAPHDPRQAPKEYVDMYPAKEVAVPESFIPRYPYCDEMGCSMGLRDEALAPMPRTEYSVQVNRQEYYAAISYMDLNIGRILDAIEASGDADNTYIIFSADHGLAVGDHGLIGKQNLYDSSVRVPLLVSGPGIKRCEINEMVYLQDAMATAMDIAQSEHMGDVDFKSLIPLATGKGKDQAANKAVYGAYMGLQRMVRTDDYKMIIYPVADAVRLYDIKNDPCEMNDLAKDPKYRKTMDNMLKELQKLQVKMGDQLDVKLFYDRFFAGL